MVIAAALSFTSTVAAEDLEQVRSVIDGDTVELRSGELVRLVGINAPEMARGGEAPQPYALEASLALRELVEGEAVRVIPGKEARDRHGRLLARLELPDGRDPHRILLTRGYAAMVAIAPNVDHVDDYREAERQARRASLGIWSLPGTIRDFNRADAQDGTGFTLGQGRVVATGSSRKNHYLDFAGNVSVQVSRTRWATWWPDSTPDDFTGAELEARGWCYLRDGRYYIVLGHHSMLTPPATTGD